MQSFDTKYLFIFLISCCYYTVIRGLMSFVDIIFYIAVNFRGLKQHSKTKISTQLFSFTVQHFGDF